MHNIFFCFVFHLHLIPKHWFSLFLYQLSCDLLFKLFTQIMQVCHFSLCLSLIWLVSDNINIHWLWNHATPLGCFLLSFVCTWVSRSQFFGVKLHVKLIQMPTFHRQGRICWGKLKPFTLCEFTWEGIFTF